MLMLTLTAPLLLRSLLQTNTEKFRRSRSDPYLAKGREGAAEIPGETPGMGQHDGCVTAASPRKRNSGQDRQDRAAARTRRGTNQVVLSGGGRRGGGESLIWFLPLNDRKKIKITARVKFRGAYLTNLFLLNATQNRIEFQRLLLTGQKKMS